MIGLALGSMLAEGQAGAQEPPEIKLDWRAPAGCPDQRAMSARVNQLLGEHGVASATPVDVRASVTALSSGGFRAELDIVQEGGERTRLLHAPTCIDVAEASAVVIALAVSPPVERQMPLAPRPSLPTTRAPPSENRGPPAPVANIGTGSEARRAWWGDVNAGIAADFGATASAAVGVGVLGMLQRGDAESFGLRASFFPARDSTVPGAPGHGVRVLLAAFAPLACVGAPELPVELSACAEFEFGYLHADGFGPPLHYGRSASWLAPGGGLSAAFPKRGRLRSRLLMRFMLKHPQILNTRVMLVGESYGGTRATVMLERLFNYQTVSDPTASYQDAQLAAQTASFFTNIFGTSTPTIPQLTSKFAAQVLIEPQLFGLFQLKEPSAGTPDAFNRASNCSADIMVTDPSTGVVSMEPCWSSAMPMGTMPGWDATCDQYECDKSVGWTDGLAMTAATNLNQVSILASMVGANVKNIEWMYGRSRPFA